MQNHDTQNQQWQLGGVASTEEPLAAPSRTHHRTTKNWSFMDRKPFTACQQDWHASRRTGPTSLSSAKNAAAQ